MIEWRLPLAFFIEFANFAIRQILLYIFRSDIESLFNKPAFTIR